MSKSNNLTDFLTDLAIVIRNTDGTEELIDPQTFSTRIVNYQTKTVTPSTSSQTITKDSGYMALETVTVNAMPSGSATTPATTITANPSTPTWDSSTSKYKITVSKTQSITPTVVAGYVASGTAGTITVSGGSTLNQSTWTAEATPSGQTPTTLSFGGTYTLAAGYYPSARYYKVPSGVAPSGNIELTKATSTDVSAYATATVRSAASITISGSAVTDEVTVGTVSSGYYPISAKIKGFISAGTAGWFSATSSAIQAGTATQVGKIVAGTITNNTSGGTSSGTINAGAQIKIGAGYYGSDIYYQAAAETALTGDAAVGNVLSGKTFYSNSYTKLTGTMTNNGAVSATLDTDTTSYTVPAGYHNGSGTVSITLEEKSASASGDITPTSGKVLSKVTVRQGSATPSAVYEVLGSQGTSSTSVTSQYFKITPTTNVLISGWIASISDGTVQNYKVKDGGSFYPTSGTSTTDCFSGNTYNKTSGWIGTGSISVKIPSATLNGTANALNLNSGTISSVTGSGTIDVLGTTAPASLTINTNGYSSTGTGSVSIKDNTNGEVNVCYESSLDYYRYKITDNVLNYSMGIGSSVVSLDLTNSSGILIISGSDFYPNSSLSRTNCFNGDTYNNKSGYIFAGNSFSVYMSSATLNGTAPSLALNSGTITNATGTGTITTLGSSSASGVLYITNNGYNSSYTGTINVTTNTYGTIKLLNPGYSTPLVSIQGKSTTIAKSTSAAVTVTNSSTGYLNICTLPTATSSSASGTSKATISRSTSTQYLNIPAGYNETASYYTISATANMTLPSSASSTSSGTRKAYIYPSTGVQYLNIPTGYNSTASYYQFVAGDDVLSSVTIDSEDNGGDQIDSITPGDSAVYVNIPTNVYTEYDTFVEIAAQKAIKQVNYASKVQQGSSYVYLFCKCSNVAFSYTGFNSYNNTNHYGIQSTTNTYKYICQLMSTTGTGYYYETLCITGNFTTSSTITIALGSSSQTSSVSTTGIYLYTYTPTAACKSICFRIRRYKSSSSAAGDLRVQAHCIKEPNTTIDD